jgi:biopolymer transport protein ExbD
MGMNFGPFQDDTPVMSTINTTPLVDVMLVLLIIFLITIPVVTTSIQVNLPKERVALRETPPGSITISVDQKGDIFWYDARIESIAVLIEKLKVASQTKPQPQIQVRGDQRARYESVGKVLLACQQAGIAKVAFITEPPSVGG